MTPARWKRAVRKAAQALRYPLSQFERDEFLQTPKGRWLRHQVRANAKGDALVAQELKCWLVKCGKKRDEKREVRFVFGGTDCNARNRAIIGAHRELRRAATHLGRTIAQGKRLAAQT